ncbi:hypothetical protein MKZ38_008925 [Zalerion maritima]|uniref:chitinase n=1 Tax=Zalerion maritima TaxID=339359 RepID=A0AAD5WM94_9PEZI|nr:hypothetical protein MKZ38_008925 [Zalerion maritima]
MPSTSKKARMAASVASVMFTNAVYFPNYRIYQGDTPGGMNYSCISHVFYAHASVGSDGGLSDEWADCQAPCDGVQGGLGSLMHLKQQHPHLQVILSVGGGNSSQIYPMVASSAAMRDTFARSARGLVEASGLDGIDIAWEYPCDLEQGQNFLALLAAVRLYLPDDQYTLTAMLPAGKAVLQCIDVGQAANYLDYINLMAYDFTGHWSLKSGHQSQLYAMHKHESSGSGGVTYLMSQGCPAKKILLGIPVFGRSFLHATGPDQKFKGAGGTDGVFEYNQLPRPKTKEAVDKRSVSATCVGGDGGFVTYDNPETVKTKAGFCKQKGLGGLFYWTGPADARDKSRSLVAAGFRALHTS